MIITDKHRRATTAELLAMPDDGIDRQISCGRLKAKKFEYRTPAQARASSNISFVLGEWLARQPEPRGGVLTGDQGFQLHSDPDALVDTNVAFISANLAKSIPDDALIINGIPLLAVEILSPSDKQEDVLDKIRDYLDAGVPIVWLVEPVFKTITVFRPDPKPQMFSGDDELTAAPQLPGFKISAAQVFE